MMLKRYILTSLLAATTAAAFSFGSASDVYADNDRDRIRTDFFRVENDDNRQNNSRRDDDSRDDVQVVSQVPINGNNGTNSNNVSVPEPATMLLIGSALGGLALVGRRRNRE